jgi:hypothetical protein
LEDWMGEEMESVVMRPRRGRFVGEVVGDEH